MRIPEHVLRAFQLDGEEGVATSDVWDGGVRFGRVVVAPAQDAAVWSAKVRERAESSLGLRFRVLCGQLMAALWLEVS